MYRLRLRTISGAISGNITINLYGPNGWQARSSGAPIGTDPEILFTAETDYVAVVGYIANGAGQSDAPCIMRVVLQDVTDAGDENIAPIDTPTAKDTHQPGDLLTVGGTLYKATQTIAPGETINSTNVTETTVAAQLAALEARIAALEG
jgi:hypothetical protein